MCVLVYGFQIIQFYQVISDSTILSSDLKHSLIHIINKNFEFICYILLFFFMNI